MSDGGTPRWVVRGKPSVAGGRWGSLGASLASDEESELTAPAEGAPVEKVEMVDCLVRAMGADVREEGEEPVVESRKAGAAV